MLIAKTTIDVNGKKIKKGQAVSALSSFDKIWMIKAGYIEDTSKKAGKKR